MAITAGNVKTPRVKDNEKERVEEDNQILRMILDLLRPLSFERADRILTWIQMKVEQDWDE